MSRLWSRLGARTAAVALLSVGVAGGFYLGEDRETRRSDATAPVGQVVVEQSRYVQTDQVVESARYQTELRAIQRAEAAELAARKAAAERAARKKREAEAKAKAEAEAKAKAEAEAKKAANSKPYDGPIPASCNEYSGNREIGCALLLDSGFGIDQMPCLDKLWTKESGWNHKARNSSSGAYGIPQSLPGSKMGSAGDDWETNPATQIEWGLGYIKGRYGTPCKAWGHSQDVGWY
ncbi:lytic transglycosylase domain-containing protein [Micromonospora cathayae]|uniref:Lytic transglycosylase domain-containing protein n=1 Tax=Micromonospora cathayae TaxID=3028804 RepID=A0ABY7ZV45_9ACTN|nr:lytic transglycosylase domain-containing protein [Micromonospora sp. HUAS 3]WDZ86845.1 lytic transglycosylase domain-containing protein [Micromonospora sp. HUAS 3]